MDNLTHSLFALTLAHTPLRHAGRGTTEALLLASNAPDIDIVTAFAGGSTSYLAGHRGPTHGPLGVIGLAAVTTLLVRLEQGLRRNGGGAGRASTGALFGVAVMGVACHILMDLPTSYGTRLLSPFSDAWYAADWLPIIDIYLLIILAAGLVVARLKPAARRRAAAAVLLLMTANYALRGTLHHLAVVGAAGEVPAAIATVQRWPNSPELKLPGDRACAPVSPSPARGLQAARACLVDAAALPTFLSPFRWRLIQEYSTGYAVRDLDLLRPRQSILASAWRDADAGPWVSAASATPIARVLLSFSRFPAARVVERGRDRVVVQVEEVRFLGGPELLRDDIQARGFFKLRVSLGLDGRILEQRFGN